jgi:hypothetical protein
MKKIVLVIFICLFGQLFNCSIFAHHAMEYIEMESYSTALQGQKVFHLHFDYFVPNKDDSKENHWEFTPGISYGITDRLMFDFHTHFAKFGPAHIVDPVLSQDPVGPPPFMEAGAISFQYRLTEYNQLPVDLGLVFTYEFPYKRSKDLLDGKEVYEFTIIGSKDFGLHSNVCLNLKFGKDGDEEIKEWGLGVKTPLIGNPDGPAAGVEFLGDYEGAFQILPGVYIPLIENVTFKTGLGFGNKKSDNLRCNATLMYRF